MLLSSNLIQRLLKIGGVRVDSDVSGVAVNLSSAKSFALKKTRIDAIVFSEGSAPHKCHDNVEFLARAVPELEIWTGMALSQQGTWMNHSWCYHPVWKLVIETTVPFKHYFGVKIAPELPPQPDETLGIKLLRATHRVCKKCGLEKCISDFRLNATKRGPRLECRECENLYRCELYERHPEKRLEAVKKYQRTNRDKICRKKKEARAANPEKHKADRRRQLYRISPEEFTRILVEQGGKCALCCNTTKVLCVDHCHKSKKVRGLLCKPCNTWLGRIKDSVEVAFRAPAYLQKFSV